MQTLPMSDSFRALHESMQKGARASGEPDWLVSGRAAAFAAAVDAGFPTKRVEAWKYTNLRPIAEGTFVLPTAESRPDTDGSIHLRRENEIEIIFVDGHFAPVQSTQSWADGLSITPLQQSLTNGSGEALKQSLSGARDGEVLPFAALNSALLTDGVVIRIAANVAIERRIHVLFLTTGAQPNMLVSPRVIVQAEAGSQASIVQSHIGRPAAHYLTNAVTDIHVGENAHLRFCRVQAESDAALHVGGVWTHQEANSSLNMFDFSRGAIMSRNDIHAAVDGEGSEIALNGCYAVTGRQHVDNHTVVDHRVPHTSSRQTYKGILNGKSRAVFNGTVRVLPGACQTDGYQLNQNLLLSKRAHVDAKPQLEIANDDVKCTHGATIGQLDDDQLFYLESRGIARRDAVEMLSRAFAEDVLFLLEDQALQDSLRGLMDDYFGQTA